MPNIVDTAFKVLEGKSKVSHSTLIRSVCDITGNSYESVRGTLIKRNCKIFSGGWHYKDGYIVAGNDEAIVVDYTTKPKRHNWEVVRKHLPTTIDTMVTLGGINGTDIEVFAPRSVISYDYDSRVLDTLKDKFPHIVTVEGDIMRHTEPVDVLNLDLVGYMCGSRFADFQQVASVGHRYIIITIQGQVGGFRNRGEWKAQAAKKYRNRKDKNLAALKEAMQGYKLLLNRFYSRGCGARRMRTTVWRCK